MQEVGTTQKVAVLFPEEASWPSQRYNQDAKLVSRIEE